MLTKKPVIAALIVITVSVSSTGCRTLRPIEPLDGISAPKVFAKIDIGDLVSVEMTDGTRHRFEVRGIEGDALVSDSGRRYSRSEIATLHHESVDAGKTVGLVTGIVASYAIVMKILTSIDFFGK